MPTLFEQPTAPPARPETLKQKVPHVSRTSAFTSYALRPKDIRFETQEETEEVILFLRQHIILLLPWFFVGGLMALAPTVVFPFALRFLKLPIAIPFGYIVVGTVFWYLLTFGFVLMKFIHWFFNIFIVTNERIIDIDFINLLYKEFSEARLERVQDISYRTTGVLATMVNYGNVMIQTAGEQPNFVFESVPHPDAVVEVISDLAHPAKGTV
jgi:hypothetical protein